MKLSDLFEAELGGSAPLYHATNLENIQSILKNNMLRADTGHEMQYFRPELRGTAEGQNRINGVSLTRSRNFAEEWGDVILVFDQDKVRHNNKLVPINYFHDSGDHYVAQDREEHEEFVIGAIKNLNKCLTGIYFSTRVQKDYLDWRWVEKQIAPYPEEFNGWKAIIENPKYTGQPVKQKKAIGEEDEEHWNALEKTGYWGENGAGCLFLALDTKKILFNLRSGAVEEPNTYGTFGGAIDRGETPLQALQREIKEEVGVGIKITKIIPLYTFNDPGKFTYHNYLVIVDKEFKPKLSWESSGFKWVDNGNWPAPLHFGVKKLLNDAKTKEVISQFTDKEINEARNLYEGKEFLVPLTPRYFRLDRKSVKNTLYDLMNGKFSISKTPVEVENVGHSQMQVIDGYHRIVQAILLGKKKIKVVLTKNQLEEPVVHDSNLWNWNINALLDKNELYDLIAKLRKNQEDNRTLYENGRIIQGVNTPPGITIDHTKDMAARLGFNVSRDGRPPIMPTNGTINKTPQQDPDHTKNDKKSMFTGADLTKWTNYKGKDMAD